MHIKELAQGAVDFFRKERSLLQTERANVSQFCSQVFGIISLIMVFIFGILMILSIPYFNTTYLVFYTISFAISLVLTILFRRTYKLHKNNYLPLVYAFVLFLYVFAIAVSISSTAGSHAATSIICLQVVFPLLIFDRSLHVNVLVTIAYIVHSVLAYYLKERPDFILDVFNGGAFTLVGIIIGEYERSVKLSNFEKDRTLIYQKDTDMLTELSNRRMLFERLTAIQESHGALAGLFMIDIDHFKIYNDTLGHQAGDTCLKTLGKCFADFGAANGFEFYRYGGEEFCALTTTDSYDELRNHAEALRKAVESLSLPFASSEAGVVTISIGFAPHYYTQNYEVTVKQADDALYNAKRTGRNRIFGSR